MAEPKRIVIVGGVAGGASAAARARRLSEDAEIVIFERGEHISFANCGLPYHIGGAITERERLLVQTPEGMQNRFRVDVRTRCEVLRVDREARQVTVRNLETGEEGTEPYDVLILSPGAEPLRPPIPGVDCPGVFTLRNLRDTDAIIEAVAKAEPRHAVVVGGGYIGLEMAEALRERDLGVTLVELEKQVFLAADPEMVAPVHQQLEMHGVDLRLGTSITTIREEEGHLNAILSTGESVPAGLVVLAVGIRPEVQLARAAGLEIGHTGGILVDEHMRSSDPNVFAVGDAVEVTHLVGAHKVLLPLAGPANRQGRIAADNALGRESVYYGSQGTAICKVFDLAIGMTGLSERSLKKAGVYPGAKQLSLKLLFDPDSGQVFGAQAVGAEGIDKRIDVIAVAIRAGLTVRDLAEQELSYAPPYGSAKDPVNYAGFVATNVLNGDARLCHVEDAIAPGDNQLLLDVREPAEVEAGTIPGAISIPVDKLRQRLGDLPQGKEVLAFCQVGLRGYLACRILSQNGFACRNLTGGYKTYQAAVGMLPQEEDFQKEIVEDTGEHAPAPAAKATDVKQFDVVKEIDAQGLQCPGPIMKLRTELEQVAEGQAVTIVAGDPGFPSDVAAWCESTGNRLLEIVPKNGACQATILKQPQRATGAATAATPAGRPKGTTLVLFSGDLDNRRTAEGHDARPLQRRSGQGPGRVHHRQRRGGDGERRHHVLHLLGPQHPSQTGEGERRQKPRRTHVRVDDAPRGRPTEALQDEHGRHGRGDDQGHHAQEERRPAPRADPHGPRGGSPPRSLLDEHGPDGHPSRRAHRRHRRRRRGHVPEQGRGGQREPVHLTPTSSPAVG